MFPIVVKCHKLQQQLAKLTFQSLQVVAHLQVEGMFIVFENHSKIYHFSKIFNFSDSDSDFDDVPDTKHIQQKAPSMPSFMDTASSGSPPPVANIPKETKASSTAKSMPQFLNDDLQLSESDEDSD